jgi:hypothetical protein
MLVPAANREEFLLCGNALHGESIDAMPGDDLLLV